MAHAHLNHIATAVPAHDVHEAFSAFALTLFKSGRDEALFRRLAGRCQIEHRYSVLNARQGEDDLDDSGFYRRGRFPDTGTRMQRYRQHAFALACAAIDRLRTATTVADVTHLIVTSCTGFYAPGLDLEIIARYGLSPGTERTCIGFMGCYAAFNGLKLAHHVVRSAPEARVLMLNLELCTLHLQETGDLETLLSFLIFGDGCAASIVSAAPHGLRLDSFAATTIPVTEAQITWNVGNAGFDMVLSGQVPASIAASLPEFQAAMLAGRAPADIEYWGVHPGGRSVLDAVQRSLDLPAAAMRFSREVLRAFGNMSSATVMFVLKDILELSGPPGAGCALAFGPGVTVESMAFHKLAA